MMQRGDIENGNGTGNVLNMVKHSKIKISFMPIQEKGYYIYLTLVRIIINFSLH